MAEIGAEEFEAAEKILQMRGDIGGMKAVFDTVELNPDSTAKLVEHHVAGTLRQIYPNLDPRLEPAINTLCVHFLLVGILVGRGKGQVVGRLQG